MDGVILMLINFLPRTFLQERFSMKDRVNKEYIYPIHIALSSCKGLFSSLTFANLSLKNN